MTPSRKAEIEKAAEEYQKGDKTKPEHRSGVTCPVCLTDFAILQLRSQIERDAEIARGYGTPDAPDMSGQNYASRIPSLRRHGGEIAQVILAQLKELE